MGKGKATPISQTHPSSVPDVQWGLGQAYLLEPYCPLDQLPYPSYPHNEVIGCIPYLHT